MATLLHDLRFAVRMLVKNPGFTAAAVLTLALGIGANTAVFSVIDGVLLRPLPYRNPAELVVIWETNAQAAIFREPTSAPNFLDWRAQNRALDGMAATANWIPTLSGQGDPQQLTGSMVTAEFSPVLGVAPALGRNFLPEEDRPGHEAVVILSHSLWERQFGSAPNVPGRKITLNERVFTVIGVMPPGFRHPELTRPAKRVEVWRPLALPPDPRGRRGDFLRVFARTKPGVSLQQARTEMTAISERLARQYPEANAAFKTETVPLTEAIVGEVSRPLWLLLGAVGLLLLIACANVASLLLARATERRREFAIRAALGGARTRLFRQLITESLLLSLVGAVLGVLLAVWGLNSMVALGGAAIPRSDQVHVDGWVLAFTLAVSVLTGVLFGVFPAVQACRSDLGEALKAGGRSAASGFRQNRLRALLVASEMALTLLLLVGAGLLLRSFWRIQSVQLGFQPARVLTAELKLPAFQKPDPVRNSSFLAGLLDRLQYLPGAEAVGGINSVPLSGRGAELDFRIQGRPEPPPNVVQDAIVSVATPGYFRAMGIALRRGRLFTFQDAREAPPVALISEAMARRYFSAEDPLGKRIDVGEGWMQIAGVVADVRHQGVLTEPKAQIYMPHAQKGWPLMTLVVRARKDPNSLIAALRHELRLMDKNLALANIKTAEQLVSDAVGERRFAMLLLVLFAALALALAAIGIYGVIAYSVAQRTQEIGVRMALGAQRSDVLRLVLRQGLGMAWVGLGAGIPAALVLTRLLSSMLYGVTPSDPLTFASVIVFFTAVAALASYLPARRATRIDPMVALRYE
jgi:predicted permease